MAATAPLSLRLSKEQRAWIEERAAATEVLASDAVRAILEAAGMPHAETLPPARKPRRKPERQPVPVERGRKRP